MDYLTYSSRLDHILEMIRKGSVSSPNQIAEKYNCSEKTVRRMINYLRYKGNAIDYCRKTNRYILKEN
jgi:DeoR/GlpR family transcriptional regulator of sugar metabolism